MSDNAAILEELMLKQEALKLQTRAEMQALKDKMKQEKEAEKKRIRDEEMQGKEQLLLDAVKELFPYFHWRRHMMGDKPVVKYYVRPTLKVYQITEFSSSDRGGLANEISRYLMTNPETAELFLACNKYYYYSKKPAELRGPEVADLILAKIALNTEELLNEPVPLSNDPHTCCRTFIDLNTLPTEETPCWGSFLSRIDRPKEFLAFIYSIFVENDRGRQICWIRDSGGGGKSTMIRAITTALGNNIVATVDAKKLDTNYFFASVAGKRLAVDPDCQFLNLVSHPRIHNITGGDIVPIERKFHDVVHEKVYAKMLVCSNYYPQVTQEKNQFSRMLMFDMRTREGDVAIDLEWEKGLIAETKSLLGKAAAYYHEFSENCTIDNRSESFIRCISAEESEIGGFLHKLNIQISPDRVMFITDMKELYAKYMLKNNVSAGAESFRYAQFERWLYTQEVTRAVNDYGVIFYRGIGREEGVDPNSRGFRSSKSTLKTTGGDDELLT
jgi:hypothetical protein